MFSRKKDVPQSDAISSDLRRVIEQSKKYVLLQISAFERVNLAQIPFYGRNEDVMIGAYIWGFLDGHQQVCRDDLNWAGPDKRCEALALMAVAVSQALFGAKRHARLVERLPSLALGYWPSGPDVDDKVRTVLEVGGTDGMACAQGRESRWTMGGLHHFLLKYVEPILLKYVEPKWPGLAPAAGRAG